GLARPSVLLAVWLAVASLLTPHHQAMAQGDDAKSGYLIEVPLPMGSQSSTELLNQLTRLAESAPDGERITVVLRYSAEGEAGEGTAFEDALKISRAITSAKLRRIRVVSLVETSIVGHSVLPILASDSLILRRTGTIANATVGETTADETIALSYRAIAAKRGLFPPPIVTALVDPGQELARISKVGGGQIFAVGDELAEIRKSGQVLSEEVWSAPGVPLRLTSKQLREAKIAAGIVDSDEQAAELLDLAKLNPVDGKRVDGEATGALLEIAGSIAPGRVRRWQSNLSGTLEGDDVNTWLIVIDSGGGDIDQSATLAGWFGSPEPPLRDVAGFIRGEARGDAALIALSCDPLYMSPDSTLGGPGSDVVTQEDLDRYEEMIDQIARNTKRPAALIRGLLNRDLVVYRYINKKTGRVRYSTEDDLVRDAADPDAERDRWNREDEIDLSAGLSAAQALELGLIDGESRSLEDMSRRIGLQSIPKAVTDRGIVRFVEKLGRSQALAFLLLFVGFVMMSAEANAPGLSIPGFLSMVCFALYFWIKFLAGTAEWLELVLFAVGLMCIGIEIFVLPGFGVFGIGGLAMMILGLVLMSQTFVIPKNTYQIEVLTRGLWIAMGGAFGLIGGFVIIRMLFPHVPLFRGLVMDAPDADLVHEAEKLADFAHLEGQIGSTTTPLMPSGKAQFGNDIVAVVSDGTAVAKGDRVRVIEIHGNRIVVEAVDS
ncbi:MAG: nodulation protein NfeD, partial [Pirellulaceae bacterium]|nr:nodulation protein NfeD [Pirellulaceae bacterium]